MVAIKMRHENTKSLKLNCKMENFRNLNLHMPFNVNSTGISQKYGLISKDREDSEGCYAQNAYPEKEAVIREAFISFGVIKNGWYKGRHRHNAWDVFFSLQVEHSMLYYWHCKEAYCVVYCQKRESPSYVPFIFLTLYVDWLKFFKQRRKSRECGRNC